MTRIVSIGECMIEMAPQTQRHSYQLGFAGDTLNTAWYLRQLMPDSDHIEFMTTVGDDALSDQMVAFLSDAAIGTSHIARRKNLTVGLYMIQLADGERSFSYWRGQSAARSLAQDQGVMAQALSNAEIAYFSGITLAILPSEDRSKLLAALSEFRRGGGIVVFDPNLRLRLWDTAQEMTQAVMAAAAVSDIVLPSHEDEAHWFKDSSPEATAQRYADQGAQTVVVKNGPDRIVVQQGGILSEHDPVRVADIVDTTAAGDSFNAGFLAGWSKGQTLDQAIMTASRVAAHVIQYRGALVPLPASFT